jgi:ankyrin repeat protein
MSILLGYHSPIYGLMNEAIITESFEIIKFLLNTYKYQKDELNAFWRNCINNTIKDMRIIKLFLEKCGFDINEISSEDGLSMLHIACLTGNKKLVDFLVENGGDLKIITQKKIAILYKEIYSLASKGYHFMDGQEILEKTLWHQINEDFNYDDDPNIGL